MPEKKCLLIYLTPNYIRKALLIYNHLAEDTLEFKDEKFLELFETNSVHGSPTKFFSKKDQLEVLDFMRHWIKEIERSDYEQVSGQKTEIEIIASPEFLCVEGANSIISAIKTQFGLEVQTFSSIESARQSFMGFKKNLLGYRPNSRLMYLSLEKEKTVVAFGDLYRQDKIIEMDLGINHITEFAASLRKTSQVESLTLFVKANLYRFIEQARFFGKPQLVCFDENTTRLISKAFLTESKTQRVSIECFQQLSSKIIDSDFQYLSNANWINNESLDYVSAHLILLSFLVEGLGASNSTLDLESRFKGFMIDKLLEEGELQDQFAGHIYDWRRSAHELLLRFSPMSFNRSAQISLLASKIFDSSHGWLHMWSSHERKILWLSSFFSSFLSQQSFELALQTLANIQGVSQNDNKLIVSVIGLSSINDIAGQSKYLDALPPEKRSIARKMSSMLQLAKALDITGRSAVQSVLLEAKPRAPERTLLKVSPRLNPAPELIQVGILKKSFENAFDQKLEVELLRSQNNQAVVESEAVSAAQ